MTETEVEIETKLGKAQLKAYLLNNNISISDQLPLALIFPQQIGNKINLRHLPNDCSRSSLFTVRNRREPRFVLTRKKLFHYNKYVTILYTGQELRADSDELVWLQILKYSEKVPFGKPFKFTLAKLIKDLGFSNAGKNYELCKTCLERLKATSISIKNTKAYGISGAISLIQKYIVENNSIGREKEYTVWIDPNLIILFSGNTFTSHFWPVYKKLTPVARRLADYIESHKEPFPLNIQTFQKICGSEQKQKTGWKRIVKKACDELEKAKIIQSAEIVKNPNNKGIDTIIFKTNSMLKKPRTLTHT